MTKTLQDFLGADFVDRDTRSDAEKAASVEAAKQICLREGDAFEDHGDFIVILQKPDNPDEDWNWGAGDDMSRVILHSLNIDDNYHQGENLVGAPLAVLTDVFICNYHVKSTAGTLQYIGGNLVANMLNIENWDNCPTPASLELFVQSEGDIFQGTIDEFCDMVAQLEDVPQLAFLKDRLCSIPFSMNQAKRPATPSASKLGITISTKPSA